MYADPMPITWKGTDYTLGRVSAGNNSASYYGLTASGSDARVDISHQYSKTVTRRMAKLSVTGTEDNVFADGLSLVQGSTCYLVLQTPSNNGLVLPTVAIEPIKTLMGFLNYDSWGYATKFAGGEV